jgi:hypothetical protein
MNMKRISKHPDFGAHRLVQRFGALAMAATPKWEAIVLNDQGMFYIDANSVTQESGRKVLWSAIDYKKTQMTAQGQAYLSAQTQLMINCKPRWHA